MNNVGYETSEGKKLDMPDFVFLKKRGRGFGRDPSEWKKAKIIRSL
jgi:hypothetical protein